MKLIIGLWNPWDKYKTTRHNIWFILLDKFRKENNFENFSFQSKFKAEISTWIYNWEKTILLKPQTFMNLSWESIQKICNFHKIDIDNLIVIYDDLSMDFWKIRFRDKWSAGWHNWVKDIIRCFWEDFKRIKIWIWLNQKFEVSDWVLSKFIPEELIEIDNWIYQDTYNLLKENF